MTAQNESIARTSTNAQQRVLIISDAAPHRNGVGAYYADLMHQLSEHVARIEMISPEVVGGHWQGGWSLPLPGDATQKICFPNAFDMQKRIKQFNPTVIVVPTPGLFGLLAVMMARRLSVPVIIGFHTWFEKLAHLYWNKLQGGLTKTYFEMVNKSLFKFSDSVLANSQEMVEIARANGAAQVDLMGTPISSNLITQPVRQSKSIKKVLFMGRLAAEKNVEAFIQAAMRCPHLHFTIAGDGPMKSQLEMLAQDMPQVEFVGWVGREDITELMDSHDALVLPSKVESFGTVAMEAMARQKLVLVSNACGITDWPNLKAGLQVFDTTAALVGLLHKAARLSEFEVYRQGVLARQSVLEHLAWNRDKWLNSFEQLTQQSQQHRSLQTLVPAVGFLRALKQGGRL